MTELILIGYLAVMAMEQNCILGKQCEHISGLITDCRNLLGGWMNSDRKRFRGEAVSVQDPALGLASPVPGIS